MAAWINSGQVAELIIALTFLEIFALVIFRRALSPTLTTAKLLPNILAGDFLLFAWLTSIHHAGWHFTALALLAALLAHLTDLWRRWRQ